MHQIPKIKNAQTKMNRKLLTIETLHTQITQNKHYLKKRIYI